MTRVLRVLGLLLTMTLMTNTSAANVAIEPGVSLELAQYRAAHLSNLAYDLELDIPEDRHSPIRGTIAITFDYRPGGQPLQLDFRESASNILDITANGKPIDVVFDREHIVLPEQALQPGNNRVQINFIAGDGSLNRSDEFLYTLFVPDRARTAFPLFDQPDLKATFSLTLLTPTEWAALSNGPLLTRQATGDKLRWQFAPTEAISSYLISFVAGRFETVTRQVNGRSMTLLHRETDVEKVSRNLDALFELHGTALSWMEQYTGIPLPFSKLDFALIPAFQYGGMEHTGAIQYKASSLMLEAEPTQGQLLGRASLIAHEVAHMWFGNLVTMQWFNDVWTKEVFANFMAAKMVNPSFPEIDHELNFLVRHYPGAYGVDRSAGANPIRQSLDNLNLAGQMYGAIIYRKAPIMMRQLELILGETAFQQGMRKYLSEHSYANATWPDLVAILDELTETDLERWSQVWVNTAGRSHFDATVDGNTLQVLQSDPSGNNRVWPQRFTLQAGPGEPVAVDSHSSKLQLQIPESDAPLLFNADGRGYGLFPAELALAQRWTELSELERGSLLVNLYENVLQGNIEPYTFIEQLLNILPGEQDQLLRELALKYLASSYTSLLTDSSREQIAPKVDAVLWDTLQASQDNRRQLYEAYAELTQSPEGIARLKALWQADTKIEGLQLSEVDRTRLAEILAIRIPGEAQKIIDKQLASTVNPDNRRRLIYLSPSLAADPAIRDRFFASLSDENNRQVESWTADALANLHHPSRRAHSVSYLQRSLELLEEIQVTGDIFFPTRWLQANFANHNSDKAVQTVEKFLQKRPDYNPQLRMKILQAADLPIRAHRILYLETD